MTHIKKPFAIICLLYMTSFFGCAVLSGELEGRVNRLENQNIVLERKLSESEAQLAVQNDKTKDKLLDSNAELNANIDAIQENIRILTGRIEVVEHQLNKEVQAGNAGAQEEADHFMTVEESLRTNEERILNIERYLDMESATAGEKPAVSTSQGAQSSAPSSAIGSKGSTDSDLYASAKADYDKGRYDEAKLKFQEFIQKFPDSENADNAQFWIGEIFFNQKMYEYAIVEYEKVVENYPNGNKVPSAYLKQALAFYEANDKKTARYLLEKTISNFPDSNQAEIARKKLDTFK